MCSGRVRVCVRRCVSTGAGSVFEYVCACALRMTKVSHASVIALRASTWAYESERLLSVLGERGVTDRCCVCTVGALVCLEAAGSVDVMAAARSHPATLTLAPMVIRLN